VRSSWVAGRPLRDPTGTGPGGAAAVAPVKAALDRSVKTGPVGVGTYTRAIDVLFACTGNICRSPMAEALLRARLATRAPEVTIGSVGRLFEGELPQPNARTAVAALGASLDGFRSRRWSAERVEGSSLVLAMERAHVRDLALLGPDVLARTFTLPEAVRLAEAHGPRPTGTDLRAWAEAIGATRDLADHLRADPDDEVPDPMGGSKRRFRACAAQLDELLARLVDLAWPAPTSTPTPAGGADDAVSDDTVSGDGAGVSGDAAPGATDPPDGRVAESTNR